MHNGRLTLASNWSSERRTQIFGGLGTQFAIEAKKHGFDQFSCTTKKGGKKWMHFRYNGVNMKCTAEMDNKGLITITIMDSDRAARGSGDAILKVFNELFVKKEEWNASTATAPLQKKQEPVLN